MEFAKKIRVEREQELVADKNGYRLTAHKKVKFFDFTQTYHEQYTKKDSRMIKMAISRFKDFVSLEYPLYKTSLLADQLDKDMIIKFVEYLQSKSKGEGASTVYKRFKKIHDNVIGMYIERYYFKNGLFANSA